MVSGADEVAAAYRELELEFGAGLDEVRAQHRHLARVWHPDSLPRRLEHEATRKMAQINNAADVLAKYLRGKAPGEAERRRTPRPEPWHAEAKRRADFATDYQRQEEARRRAVAQLEREQREEAEHRAVAAAARRRIAGHAYDEALRAFDYAVASGAYSICIMFQPEGRFVQFQFERGESVEVYGEVESGGWNGTPITPITDRMVASGWSRGDSGFNYAKRWTIGAGGATSGSIVAEAVDALADLYRISLSAAVKTELCSLP
jgi:hypothetical protein